MKPFKEQEEQTPQYANPASAKLINDLLAGKNQKIDEGLERKMTTFRKVFDDVAMMYDQKARERSAKWSPERRREALAKYRLFTEVLKGAKTKEDMLANLNAATKRLQDIQQKNEQEINAKVKAFERVVRCLELMHKNRKGRGKVKLMLVPNGKFADPRQTEYRNQLSKYLEKQYGKWRIKESPLYVTYFGEIDDRSVMLDIAGMCQATQALAILDIPPEKNFQEVLSVLSDLKLVGVDEKHAHLVVPGTQINIAGVTIDGNQDSEALPIPTGPLMSSQLMARLPGHDVAGLNAPMSGVFGVVADYEIERADAKKLADLGSVQIGEMGEILGARTTNKSNNKDLASFMKVDIKNTINKALVQFANGTVYRSMGPKEKDEFKAEIEEYLNSKKKAGDIVRYNVTVNINKSGDVEVDLSIKFKDIPEEVVFRYGGPPGSVENKNAAK